MSSALDMESIRLLEKTLGIREKVLDRLMLLELPTKPREIEALVGVAESIDRTVLSRAKIRVEESAGEVNKETKAMLSEFLLELHGNTTVNAPKAPGDSTAAPEYKSNGMEISAGEIILKTDDVNMSDIAHLQSE